MSNKIVVKGLSAVRWDKDAKVFVSWIPGLNLYSQGTTEAEAFKAAQSALMLFAERCHEKGILEKTLLKAGFREVSREEFTGDVSSATLKPFPFQTLAPVSSLSAAC